MASTKFEVSMEIFKFQGEPDVSVTLTGKSPAELNTALKTLETIAKTTTLYNGDSAPEAEKSVTSEPKQAAPVVSTADKKAPPKKPVSWLTPVGAKGLMLLRCPKCKNEFVQFLREPQTTDTPDGNYSQALNLFVRGEDGWVQMPSRSISLNDYMKQLIKAHNADIDTDGTPEEFDMTLCEHLFDGPETIEGLLAEHYTLSWALASLRDKLKHYEDALIPEIMPEGLQTIDRAIGTYGKDAQLTKAVEEMSELTKALCKLKECKRKYDTPFNRETQEVYSNIEEETADVFIMLVQLFAIFNPHELVNITKIVWDKLDRLKDNLDKEAAKQEECKDDTPEC